jgi:hypothetical protein
MPDQYDRSFDGLEEVAEDTGIITDAPERIGGSIDGVACLSQTDDLTIPTRRVGKCAVNEHNGGFGRRVPPDGCSRHGRLTEQGEHAYTEEYDTESTRRLTGEMGG